jgi:DNA-binding NarL/FixJ family response regulator
VAIERDVQGPFVGRGGELDALTGVRRDSHRYGRFAIVAGEPGIGKSRLVKEFLRSVPRGRAAIGVGRAFEHVRAPFAPWIPALQPVSAAAAKAITPGDDAFNDKGAMYAAIIAALRESSERRSSVLVLEDMHWADAASLDLLQVVAAEISSLRRLLVIATVRAGEIDEPVRALLAKPQTVLLDLRPLERSESIELVRALMPARATDSTRVERIAALSGGNPFFAAELAKNPESDGIPLTLSSAIDARISRLQEADVQALEFAAILGERFDLQLLAEMLNTAPATAAQRLEHAQRDAIVIEESDGQFRFAHALTRAMLAKRLTSARRIHIHKRAARALERRRRFDALGFAQLAYHHAGAHDPVKAYAYRMRAGGLAYNVHGYLDAATFYADAAACAEAGSLEQARALARQGETLLRAGELEGAQRAYTGAIAIFRSAGSLEDAARLYQGLAHSLYNQDRVREAIATIEQATAALPDLPPEVSDQMNLQGALYGADLSPEAGLRWLNRVDESSVSITRAGGSYYAIGAAIYASQGALEAWKRNEAAFQKNAAFVQPDYGYVGHFGNLAANALFLGIPAMSLYEQCFALARTMKMEVYEAAYASHASFERWLHGDDEAFLRYADFSARHDAPSIPALHSYVMLAAILRDPAALPNTGEVEALIAGGRNEFFGPLCGAFARALARSGDMPGARRILDAAAERLEFPYAAWEALTAMAEFGSDAARRRAKALLEPYANSSAPAFAATAAMVDALCAQHEGDIETRDRASARARELYAAMGWVRHERSAAEIGVLRQADSRLSARELQIAKLLQEGHSNRAMAEALFISEKTVEKHLARLYEKLRVNNRAGAVRALTKASGIE